MRMGVSVTVLSSWIKAVLVFWLWQNCIADRQAVARIGMLDEEPTSKVRIPQTPGCVFGDKFYDLEDTWHPELIQSGKLYCVICQCVPIINKGVLNKKGHVTCRDIKEECPIVECENPVLLPEQCCKTCPGEGLPVFRHYVRPWPFLSLPAQTGLSKGALVSDNLTPQKDFLAILTGFSAITSVATSAVGVGYFTLHKRYVVYSIDLSGLKRPRSLQITDRHGTILHTVRIDGGTRKKRKPICGRVEWPDVFSDFLRGEELFVRVDTKSNRNGEISGQILSKESLASEAYAAVLEPEQPSGYGAVVLVEVAASPPSLKFTTYSVQRDDLDGGNQDNSKKALTFTIGSRKRVFHVSTVYPDQQHVNHTKISWEWQKFKKRTLKFVASEKLLITLTLPTGEIYNGKLTARRTCNDQWALLATAIQSTTSHGGGGMANIQLLNNGILKYKMRFEGIQSQIKSISMTVDGQPGDSFCSIDSSNIKLTEHNKGGTTRGKCKKLSAEYVSALYNNQVVVSLLNTDPDQPILSGHVRTLLFNDGIQDVQDDPVLLTGLGIDPPTLTTAVGQAWFQLSKSCELQYQLVTRGFQLVEEAQLQVVLRALGSSQTGGVALDKVVGSKVIGTVSRLPDYLYNDFQNGDILLVVISKDYPDGEIGAKLRLRNKCSRQHARHESIRTNKLPVLDREAIRDSPNVGITVGRQPCLDLGVMYKEGDTWNHPKDACTICFCRRGKRECQRAMCPELHCAKPVNVTGECCPQCPETLKISDTCYYTGDKRNHIKGTVWHPFVFPFGYMPCAVCSCSDEALSQVNCSRLECPVLPCPENVAVLKSDRDCCKSCPDQGSYGPGSNPAMIPEILGDRDETDACMFKGMKYYNGTSWHPNVQPFGLMKCVTCSCMRGDTTCVRERCPRLSCHQRLWSRGPSECCPVCRHRAYQTRKSRRHRKKT